LFSTINFTNSNVAQLHYFLQNTFGLTGSEPITTIQSP
jgi:hypothetical protein